MSGGKTNLIVRDITNNNVGIELQEKHTLLFNSNYTIEYIPVYKNTNINFFINGKYVRTEGVAPYILSGDSNGKLNKWEQIKLGNFTIDIEEVLDNRVLKKDKVNLLFIEEEEDLVNTEDIIKDVEEPIKEIVKEQNIQPKENIIYEETFDTDLVEMLKTHNYWIFGYGMKATEYNSPELFKRVELDRNEGIIEIKRLKDDKDFTGTGNYNSRMELVPGYRGPWEDTYHLEAIIKFPSREMNATFIQLMGRNDQNKGKPIVVLDTFKGNVNARYRDFEMEYQKNREWMLRHPIASYNDVYNKWVKIDLYCKVSRKNDGFIKVYMNNKLVFDRKASTYWKTSNGDIKTQYGVYSTSGDLTQSIIYTYFKWSKVIEMESPVPILDPVVEEKNSKEAKITNTTNTTTTNTTTATNTTNTNTNTTDTNTNQTTLEGNIKNVYIEKPRVISKFLNMINKKDIIIENREIKNYSSENGIQLQNCENITIRNCYFENVKTGIYCINCKNIKVINNISINVRGPMPRGQFCQFNSCLGGEISNNLIYNEMGKSYPEDAINLYKCKGSSENWILVEKNLVLGGGPSKSGGGLMIGDNGGEYQCCRNNIIVDPGQYGIACAGGENIKIEDNIVWGKQQSFTNVGLYAWKQKAPTAKNISITRNKVYWINKEGRENNYWFHDNVKEGFEEEGNEQMGMYNPFFKTLSEQMKYYKENILNINQNSKEISSNIDNQIADKTVEVRENNIDTNSKNFTYSCIKDNIQIHLEGEIINNQISKLNSINIKFLK